MRRFAFAIGCVFGACSHDFTLVDHLPGDPILQHGGMGTEAPYAATTGLHVFGGFTSGGAPCPATGYCVQGGLHP